MSWEPPAQLLLPWGLYPMSLAPKTYKPDIHIRVLRRSYHFGTEVTEPGWRYDTEPTDYLFCHYASDLSGEEQPAYQGYFYRTLWGFAEVPGHYLGWYSVTCPPHNMDGYSPTKVCANCGKSEKFILESGEPVVR